MKIILDFMKTCLLGGFIVILPLLLSWLLIDELIGGLTIIATPIAALIPGVIVNFDKNPTLLAIILLIISSLLCGLILQSDFIRNIFKKLEQATIAKFAIYKSVKSLSRGILGGTDEQAYATGLFCQADGTYQLVYLIEIKGELTTILIPQAPTGFSGFVKIVPSNMIKPLSCSIGDVSGMLANWGDGAHNLAEINLPEHKNKVL